MAELSFPLEGKVYTAQEAGLWFATRTSGVHASDSLAVTSAGGMAVNVGKGVAWLKYTEFSGVSYANTEAKTLQISAAHASYPRIDRVVVRYSKANNTVALAVSKGTPASSPAAPAVVRTDATYEISLAQVRVNANATTIASVTDERTNNDVCGLMTDGVTAFDPEELGGGDADSLGGIAASVYQAFMNKKTYTVTTNTSFVSSGSITAESKGGILKVGGYLQSKAATSTDGSTATKICTISGVTVTGLSYATVIDHNSSTAKVYNIAMLTDGNKTIVQFDPSAMSFGSGKWVNFTIYGVIA